METGCLTLTRDPESRLRAHFKEIPVYTDDFAKYLKEMLITVSDDGLTQGFSAFNRHADELIQALSLENIQRMKRDLISFRHILVRQRISKKSKNSRTVWGYTELYDNEFNTLCKAKEFEELDRFLNVLYQPASVKIERLSTFINEMQTSTGVYNPANLKKKLKKNVPPSPRGLSPDFTRAVNSKGELYNNMIYRNDVDLYGRVKITLTGIRDKDFALANRIVGLTKTPSGFTWHHFDDFDPVTREATMQLVSKTFHEASYPHFGIELWSRLFGMEYK